MRILYNHRSTVSRGIIVQRKGYAWRAVPDQLAAFEGRAIDDGRRTKGERERTKGGKKRGRRWRAGAKRKRATFEISSLPLSSNHPLARTPAVQLLSFRFFDDPRTIPLLFKRNCPSRCTLVRYYDTIATR